MRVVGLQAPCAGADAAAAMASLVMQLQRLGDRAGLLRWLPDSRELGGAAGAAAALMGNLAQAAGPCLTVRHS